MEVDDQRDFGKSTILLSVLPHQLRIISLDKIRARTELIPSFMKLFFYNNSTDRFFSYTETYHEISLVADDMALEHFPLDALEKISDDYWCALHIYEGGSSPCDQITFIQRISTALAQGNISVFLISTYRADCVLIKQDDVKRAIEFLQLHFIVEVEGIDPKYRKEENQQTNLEKQIISELPVHRHMISVSPLDLYLFQLSKSCIKSHVWGLVRLFFCAEEGRDFVSWTDTSNEISIMTSEQNFLEYAISSDGLEVSPDVWRVMQIGNTHLGFSETGIVASQSAVISKSTTNIFYLSTFATDFVMIKKDEWPQVLSTLKEHFLVQEDGFVPLNTCEESYPNNKSKNLENSTSIPSLTVSSLSKSSLSRHDSKVEHKMKMANQTNLQENMENESNFENKQSVETVEDYAVPEVDYN